MTSEKKNKYLQWIQTITIVITFLLVVFGGYKGAIAWGRWTAVQEERMFKDSEERVKTQQMVAEPYSKYRMMMKNDTILEQQKFLRAAFDTINRRYANDEEDKKSRVISRAKRDSTQKIQLEVNKEIQRDIRNIENAVQLILQKVDTTQ